jgi:hypothetical protein
VKSIVTIGDDDGAGRASLPARSLLLADVRAVLPSYLVARILVLLAWLVARAVAHRYYGGEPTQLAEGLVAWDGTWYRDIASMGYSSLPLEGVRFFPLYPLSGRTLGLAMGGHVDIALVVISNLAAFFVGVLARRVVLAETSVVSGDAVAVEQAADRAVWAVTLFPSAFVLVWAYSESLLVCFAMGALLLARRRRWWWVAVLAALAALCRPVGIALAPALAVEAVRSWRLASVPERLARAVAVASPLAGLGAYLAWVGAAFGDWALPFTVQSELRGDEVDPFTRVLRGLGDLVGPERFGDGLHIPFAIAFAVLLIMTCRQWPASYGVYAAVVLVMAMSATNLNSLERYALNAFPLAMTLGVVLRPPRRERIGLAICASGLLSLAALAFLGVYVP